MAYWAKPAENYVPSYQMSGKPYLTGSASATALTTDAEKITFPTLTRWIIIENTGASAVRYSFSENGVDGNGEHTRNYFTLEAQGANDRGHKTERLELRCKDLWIRTDSGTSGYQVIASLTLIDDLDTTFSGSEGIG